MHTKSDNLEIMTGDTNEVIKDLFKISFAKISRRFRRKMRGSEFVFDGVNLLHYDFNKISLNRG